MVKSISILGSTGSIGRQTVAVAEHLNVKVSALTANRSTGLLEEQIRKLKPDFVAVYDEKAAAELAISVADTPVKVVSGLGGITEAALISGADCVVTAVSGAIGLLPTLSAIKERKRIALANKETLVCAGELVMKSAKEYGAEIIPVDSEHSAIFQCLNGERRKELKKILLTGSGGPFRGKKREELADVTAEQAVRHPNWKMGAKISVDSATMMNKGLEFIEAMHLFGVRPEDIEVVVHPQSVIHSMVELVDGTVIAQLGVPDMGLPIQYALTYPERRASMFQRLDFSSLIGLTFEKPDYTKTPCLKLAMEAASTGGTMPCIMSAANEVAVHKFLRGEIGYNAIFDCVADTVSALPSEKIENLEQILQADRAAREYAANNW